MDDMKEANIPISFLSRDVIRNAFINNFRVDTSHGMVRDKHLSDTTYYVAVAFLHKLGPKVCTSACNGAGKLAFECLKFEGCTFTKEHFEGMTLQEIYGILFGKCDDSDERGLTKESTLYHMIHNDIVDAKNGLKFALLNIEDCISRIHLVLLDFEGSIFFKCHATKPKEDRWCLNSGFIMHVVNQYREKLGIIQSIISVENKEEEEEDTEEYKLHYPNPPHIYADIDKVEGKFTKNVAVGISTPSPVSISYHEEFEPVCPVKTQSVSTEEFIADGYIHGDLKEIFELTPKAGPFTIIMNSGMLDPYHGRPYVNVYIDACAYSNIEVVELVSELQRTFFGPKLRITLFFSNPDLESYSFWDSIVNTPELTGWMVDQWKKKDSTPEDEKEFKLNARFCVILKTFTYIQYLKKKKGAFGTAMRCHIAHENPPYIVAPENSRHRTRASIWFISPMFEVSGEGICYDGHLRELYPSITCMKNSIPRPENRNKSTCYELHLFTDPAKALQSSDRWCLHK
jgi:hypothetical protein